MPAVPHHSSGKGWQVKKGYSCLDPLHEMVPCSCGFCTGLAETASLPCPENSEGAGGGGAVLRSSRHHQDIPALPHPSLSLVTYSPSFEAGIRSARTPCRKMRHCKAPPAPPSTGGIYSHQKGDDMCLSAEGELAAHHQLCCLASAFLYVYCVSRCAVSFTSQTPNFPETLL